MNARLPELLTPGGLYYDTVRARQLKAVFAATRALTTQVDGDLRPTGREHLLRLREPAPGREHLVIGHRVQRGEPSLCTDGGVGQGHSKR